MSPQPYLPYIMNNNTPQQQHPTIITESTYTSSSPQHHPSTLAMSDSTILESDSPSKSFDNAAQLPERPSTFDVSDSSCDHAMLQSDNPSSPSSSLSSYSGSPIISIHRRRRSGSKRRSISDDDDFEQITNSDYSDHELFQDNSTNSNSRKKPKITRRHSTNAKFVS